MFIARAHVQEATKTITNYIKTSSASLADLKTSAETRERHFDELIKVLSL